MNLYSKIEEIPFKEHIKFTGAFGTIYRRIIFVFIIEKLNYFIKKNIDFEIDYEKLDDLIKNIRKALPEETSIDLKPNEKFERYFPKGKNEKDKYFLEKYSKKYASIIGRIREYMSFRRSNDYETI